MRRTRCNLPACSSSASGSGGGHSNVRYDQSQIVDFLHMSSTDGDISWQFNTEDATVCNISVVLISAASVSLYADAGDNVATNPDKTAGVKISDAEGASCHRYLTEALKGFPPK